jgi:hypothetical protein
MMYIGWYLFKYWYDDILDDIVFQILRWHNIELTIVIMSNLWSKSWDCDKPIEYKINKLWRLISNQLNVKWWNWKKNNNKITQVNSG